MGLIALRGRDRAGPPGIVLAACAAVAVGAGIGLLTHPGDISGTPGYDYTAGLLLAVGLYGSTHDIDLGEARRSFKAVLVAVTVGVLLKATLIAGVMILAFHQPAYLVLGMAVAQIDPLSVAATQGNKRVSARAKAILSIWASFDDPMTVLLTVYFSALAMRLDGSAHGGGSVASDTARVFTGLLLNIALAYAVRLLWRLIVRWWQRREHPAAQAGETEPARQADGARFLDLTALALVCALVLGAAAHMTVLSVALVGLFVRLGRFGKALERTVSLAFLAASGILGVVLSSGHIRMVQGLVLGASAFAAQFLVTLLIGRLLVRPRLSRADRAHLGLGQQNGITAILLALTLEPSFPGTVGIVGPAILTVNVLHYAFQWARADEWSWSWIRQWLPRPRTRVFLLHLPRTPSSASPAQVAAIAAVTAAPEEAAAPDHGAPGTGGTRRPGGGMTAHSAEGGSHRGDGRATARTSVRRDSATGN
ncbi:hypothetical protein ACIPSA_38265 [Streptomyces sp. NPDC086549]|uniref:hypothetical protein n=1 Tax=Streptomyces sp. NPDC086549 TaxID=3365752 RepID=UPI0037FB3DCC